MEIITGKIEQCRDQPKNNLTKEEKERQIEKRIRYMKKLSDIGFVVYPYEGTE